MICTSRKPLNIVEWADDSRFCVKISLALELHGVWGTLKSYLGIIYFGVVHE